MPESEINQELFNKLLRIALLYIGEHVFYYKLEVTLYVFFSDDDLHVTREEIIGVKF